MNYWLAKSEESDYAIGDLERDGTTAWTGVRNYEARNTMRDRMKPGDLVLFYHSNGSPPGVAGTAKVAGASYPDPTQFVKRGKYYDSAATEAEPRWWLVDLTFVERFPNFVSLGEIRENPGLAEMSIFKRNRLSIHPVTRKEFNLIRKLGTSRKK